MKQTGNFSEMKQVVMKKQCFFSWLLAITVALVLPLWALGTIERQQIKLGEPVILKCNISLHHEIFWLRVSTNERPRLLMVVRLKNDGGLTQVLNYNTTHYDSCLVDKFFGLKIFRVLTNDLGSYYCGIVEGKRMEFEDGVQIYEDIDESVSNCKEASSTLPPVAEKKQISYQIFAAILGGGVLIMLLVVFIIHMITCRKIK